jgi:hypothetical protein
LFVLGCGKAGDCRRPVNYQRGDWLPILISTELDWRRGEWEFFSIASTAPFAQGKTGDIPARFRKRGYPSVEDLKASTKR